MEPPVFVRMPPGGGSVTPVRAAEGEVVVEGAIVTREQAESESAELSES